MTMIPPLQFLAIAACALGLAACATSSPQRIRMTQNDFSRLGFLEGRWKGVGLDGVTFYEHYDFTDPATLRGRRYRDAAFTAPIDGSTVAFANGEVISTRRSYRWKAVEITARRACFAPIQAPSAFCWEKTAAAAVQVTQRWVDDEGEEQQVTVLLSRVR
jgi:hypothetical protein